MDQVLHFGLLSIVPALLAVVLALLTREAVLPLLAACILGLFIKGDGIWGLPGLFERALGNANFIWVLMIEIFIGILVALLLKSGSTQEFSRVAERKIRSGKQVQVFGWLLGIFVFFSDYFSPIFIGPIMRGLTDRARISREKLAYILDSTSAPKCVLVPFSAWGVYIAGLLVGYGPITDSTLAMGIFTKSILFNFYAISALLLVLLIALGIVPEFGPMRKAERRALKDGKVLADGATPLMGAELSGIEPAPQIKKPRLLVNFFLPIALVLVVVAATMKSGSPRILEAFMVAVFYSGLILRLQGVPLKEILETAIKGIKGVTPAVIILALAYCINTVSMELGAARYVMEATRGYLTPVMLPVLTFAVCSFIAFATGTSWGTYAIMIPLTIPLALEFSGGEIDSLLLTTVAAVAGGGVFGDHCSPLSDTTILSSFGAASDHLDHVKTQLPYASAAAAITLVAYLIIGIF